MTDLIVREATTVPGIINLAGALVMLYIKPAATVLDKLLVFTLMLASLFRKRSNPGFDRNLQKMIERLLPPESNPGAQITQVAAVFITYNLICTLLIGAA